MDALLGRHEARTLISLIVPRLLENRCDGSGPWLHLPASVWVLASLEPLADLIETHGVMLAQRATDDPPADGLEPSREQFAMMGRLAPELIGVDGSPASRAVSAMVVRPPAGVAWAARRSPANPRRRGS